MNAEVKYNIFLLYLNMVMAPSQDFIRDDFVHILEAEHDNDGGFTLRVARDGKVYTFKSTVESRFAVVVGGEEYE